MEFTVVKDLKPNDIINLREVLGWKRISYNQFEKGLKNTMYKISIQKDGQVIACGRLVGDYSCKGLLSDIMVHPDYQKKGYGKIVVTELVKMVQDSLKKGELFQIEAMPTAGNTDFYVKCGLKCKHENQSGVYVWLEG